MHRLLIMALVCAFAAPAVAKKELKIATLAPKNSPWGKVFLAWGKAVKKKSKGEVTIRWYYGTQGDEQALVAKMRSGQLDGAAITSVGLSKINKNVLVLQMPGLFKDWGKLDQVRDAMKDEFARGFKAEGFTILGWGDVGLAHMMSKGKAIKRPGDLKGMKVFAWDQDIMAATTSRVLGYTPVRKSIPGLLPALQSGAVNAVSVGALPAQAMQWSGEVDHINKQVVGVRIGALVMTEAALKDLPGDTRKMIRKTGKKATKALTKRIRKKDKKAYKTLSKRMTVVKLSKAEKDAWKKKFREVRRELAGGTFPADLVNKVERLAGVK